MLAIFEQYPLLTEKLPYIPLGEFPTPVEKLERLGQAINAPQQSFVARTSDAARWNAIAEDWHRWIPRMCAWYAPTTNLMLDLVRSGSEDHVLDIAAGEGLLRYKTVLWWNAYTSMDFS